MKNAAFNIDTIATGSWPHARPMLFRSIGRMFSPKGGQGDRGRGWGECNPHRATGHKIKWHAENGREKEDVALRCKTASFPPTRRVNRTIAELKSRSIFSGRTTPTSFPPRRINSTSGEKREAGERFNPPSRAGGRFDASAYRVSAVV